MRKFTYYSIKWNNWYIEKELWRLLKNKKYLYNMSKNIYDFIRGG